MIEGRRFRLGFLADAIAAASRHVALEFSERKPAALKRLARRIERELEEDEDDLRRRLDSLEWRIQDLERRLRRTEERKLKLKMRQPRAPDPRQSASPLSEAGPDLILPEEVSMLDPSLVGTKVDDREGYLNAQ